MPTNTITVSAVRLPLVGRVGALVTLEQDIIGDLTIQLAINKQATDAVPLIAKTSDDGGVLATDSFGQIFFELTNEEKALLNTQRIYHLRVDLLNDALDVVFSQAFYLHPTVAAFSELYTMSALLSTRFVNTPNLLGEVGGAGYLDGVVTLAQPVGCIVRFKPSGGPPEEWKLTAGTEATEAGVTRRPLDYSVENQKYWLRIE